MKRSSWRLFIAVLGLVVVVASMLMLVDGQAEAQSQKVLKIGAIVPLNMKEGVEIQRWMNLFADMYNDKGGWKIGDETYKVEIVAEDGGFSDVAKSRTAAEKLVLRDGVKFLINNWGDISDQTVTITDPNHVITLGCAITDPTVKPNIQYYWNATGVRFGRALEFNYYRDMLNRGAKSVVRVNSDTQLGHLGSTLVSPVTGMVGLKGLPDVFYSPDTVDFGPVATKIMSYNPDVVDTSWSSGEAITNIIGALKDAGYKGKITMGNMNDYILDNVVARVGKEYVEGSESLFKDPRLTQKNPKMVALMDSYVKKYGEFRTEGCEWIAGWFVFEDAVNATKSISVDALKKYLDNSKHAVMNLTGYTQLVARPDLGNYRTIDDAHSTWIGIVKDGKLRSLKVGSTKDQYLISIKAFALAGLLNLDDYIKYWQKYGRPTFPDEPSLYDWANVIPK